VIPKVAKIEKEEKLKKKEEEDKKKADIELKKK
jgi:hypothetical protein